MKLRSLLESNKLLTSFLAGGVLTIGIAGMVYGTARDQNMQEKQIKELQMPEITTLKAEENKSTPSNAEKSKDNNTIEEDNYTVALSGEAPKKNIPVSMEEAAAAGKKAVEVELNVSLANAQMNMSYTEIVGTTQSGSWKGVAEVGKNKRYEFKVDAATCKVSEIKSYTRESENSAWKRTLNKGKVEEMISKQHLEAYHHIKIDLISMDCHVLSGNDYELDMKQVGEDYNFSYEIKDDTLYIKQKKILGKREAFTRIDQGEGDRVLITIPENTLIEDVEIVQEAGNVDLDNLQAKKCQIKNEVGNVEIDESKIEDLNIEAEAGNLDLQDSNIQLCKIRAEAGNAFIEKVETKSFEVIADAGDIVFGEGMKGKVKARANVGNIMIKEKENNDCQYDLKTTIGNIIREDDDYFNEDELDDEGWSGFMDDWM